MRGVSTILVLFGTIMAPHTTFSLLQILLSWCYHRVDCICFCNVSWYSSCSLIQIVVNYDRSLSLFQNKKSLHLPADVSSIGFLFPDSIFFFPVLIYFSSRTPYESIIAWPTISISLHIFCYCSIPCRNTL